MHKSITNKTFAIDKRNIDILKLLDDFRYDVEHIGSSISELSWAEPISTPKSLDINSVYIQHTLCMHE